MENQTLVPLSSGVELFNPDKHFHTFFLELQVPYHDIQGLKMSLKIKIHPPPQKYLPLPVLALTGKCEHFE